MLHIVERFLLETERHSERGKIENILRAIAGGLLERRTIATAILSISRFVLSEQIYRFRKGSCSGFKLSRNPNDRKYDVPLKTRPLVLKTTQKEKEHWWPGEKEAKCWKWILHKPGIQFSALNGSLRHRQASNKKWMTLGWKRKTWPKAICM